MNKTTVALGSYDKPLLSLLFAELVKRSACVEHYHGDLFHDALWLNEHMTGEGAFYWLAHESGTHIGTDSTLVRYLHETDPMFCFVISQDPRLGVWHADIITL